MQLDMGLPTTGERALESPFKSGDALRFGFAVSPTQGVVLVTSESDRREVIAASTRQQWRHTALWTADIWDILTGAPKNE